MKVVTRRSALLAVVLGLLLNPLITTGRYGNDRSGSIAAATGMPFDFTRDFESLEIVHVEINQTSLEVYCTLKNTGTLNLTLTEVWVNDSLVETGGPLPIPFGIGENRTYAFRYDGPWQGSILVTLYTTSLRYYDFLIELPSATFEDLRQRPGYYYIYNPHWKMLAPKYVLEAQSEMDQVSAFERPILETMSLVSKAKTELREAQNAYDRGDFKSAYENAERAYLDMVLAVGLYQSLRMMLLIGLEVSVVIVAPVIALHFLRRRTGKEPQAYLNMVTMLTRILTWWPWSHRLLGVMGAFLLAASAIIPLNLLLLTDGFDIIITPAFVTYITIAGFIFILMVVLGQTLFLLALRGLAQLYREEGIFRNAFYGFVYSIASILSLLLIPVLYIYIMYTAFPPAELMMATLDAVFMFFLLATIFYMRALVSLSTKSEDARFRAAGWLFLLGALLLAAFAAAEAAAEMWLEPQISLHLYYNPLYFAWIALAIHQVMLLSAWVVAAVALLSLKAPPNSAP